MYNDRNNDLKDTKSKQGTVKIMTDLEADGSILNARNLGYTLKWDQKHTKGGNSKKKDRADWAADSRRWHHPGGVIPSTSSSFS